mmetsp:Transcript_28379/g.60099  ORF Transcript_28379/g.60099 Transcript_28379/m.60099 type:complete len:510 (-) Transcript_28379:105-1634(-)
MPKPTIQVARSFHSLLPYSRTRSSSLRFRRHQRSEQPRKVLSAPSSRHFSASTVSIATATNNGSILSTTNDEQNGTIAMPANNAQITSDEELSSILRQFPDGIDYAFGYGSMVLSQGNATSTTDDDPPPKINNNKSMIDVIFSVNDPQSWHEQNLRRHPKHYSLLSRAGGAGFVTWMQTNFGAKIFFHPYVDLDRKTTSTGSADDLGSNERNDDSYKMATSQLKYGIVGTTDLLRDLTHWDHLYLAGRMHKPIVSICQYSDEILEAQKINLQSAVCASLLLLSGGHPRSQFQSSSQIIAARAEAEEKAEADESERYTAISTPRLYNTIASLSYTGDFRMDTGAEDPNKVRKLVHTPGMLDLWERTYQETLESLEKIGLLSVVEMTDGDKDDNATDETATANSSSMRALELDLCNYSTRKELMKNLPSKLQKYSEKVVGIPKPGIVNNDISENMVDDQSLTRGREILRQELANIVAPAARSQSIKGFFSAGVVKSWRYAMAKFAKGRLKK